MSSMRLGKKARPPVASAILCKDVVAAIAAGADVGADGVDDGLGALAFLDGVVEIGVALIVVAVGDENHDFANGLLPARGVEELVAAAL